MILLEKNDNTILYTHPLFGPLGAIIGNTIPITPKNAVNIINGKAPILFRYQETKFS